MNPTSAERQRVLPRFSDGGDATRVVSRNDSVLETWKLQSVSHRHRLSYAGLTKSLLVWAPMVEMPTTDLQPTCARDLFSGEQLERVADFRLAGRIEAKAIDASERTVTLSFSSEFPVLRTDMRGQPFYEVLDHANVDTSRIRSRAPLLYGHDRRDHLGTVLSVDFGADRVGRAQVRFSRSNFAQEKFQDVQDEILTCSSVGYDLGNADCVADGQREGIPVYRFRNWAPYEVTLTPLPADPTVGVGRSSNPNPSISVSTSAPAVNNAAEISGGAKVLSARHPQHADAINRAAFDHIERGLPVSDFQSVVLNIIATRETLAPATQRGAAIGLSARDTKRYSLMRAINLLAENRPLDGLEREASDEVARRVERKPQGFFAPDDVLLSGSRSLQTRGHTVGVPSDGGYLVGEQILGGEMVDLLRNESHVIALGARMIPGLVGNITIPRVLTGSVVYWVAEGGTINRSNAAFGQIAMKPRRLGSSVQYGREFLAQASIDAESFVRDDINKSRAVELDRVAINGKGGAEPLGILNLAAADRSTSVTFSGAATFPKAVEFEANVGTSNALSGRPAYLTTWATKAKWKTIQRFTNAGVGIWASDEDVAGYRGRATAQFPSTPTANQVIFGDWSQVVYGEWAGVDVIVDPYTGKLTGTVEVTVQQLVDLVIRQGKSFAISTDTGAA